MEEKLGSLRSRLLVVRAKAPLYWNIISSAIGRCLRHFAWLNTHVKLCLCHVIMKNISGLLVWIANIDNKCMRFY